jgi:hypothetical protein
MPSSPYISHRTRSAQTVQLATEAVIAAYILELSERHGRRARRGNAEEPPASQ